MFTQPTFVQRPESKNSSEYVAPPHTMSHGEDLPYPNLLSATHPRPTRKALHRFRQRMAEGGYLLATHQDHHDGHTYSVRLTRIGPANILGYYNAPNTGIPRALLTLLNQAEADYNHLLNTAAAAGAFGVHPLRDTSCALQGEALAFVDKYGVFLSPRPCYNPRCTKFTCQNSLHHRYVAATSRRMEMNTHSAMITIPGIMGAHQFKPIWDAVVKGIRTANMPKGHHCIGVIEPHRNGLTTEAMYYAQENDRGSLHYHLINPLDVPASITVTDAERILALHIRAALDAAGLNVDVHVQISSIEELKQDTDYIGWYIFKNIDVAGTTVAYNCLKYVTDFSLYKRHIELNDQTPGKSPLYCATKGFFQPFSQESTFANKELTPNIVPALAADFNRRYIGATEGKFASPVTWDTNAGEEVTVTGTYGDRTWAATGRIITTTARRDVPEGPYATLDSYPEHTIAEAIALCRTQLEETLTRQLTRAFRAWNISRKAQQVLPYFTSISQPTARTAAAYTSHLRYSTVRIRAPPPAGTRR